MLFVLGLFLQIISVSCTGAKTSQQSLGLTYSAVDVSQGNISSKTITVANDTASATFKVGCSAKLNHALISWDNGITWSELPLSDTTSCSINTIVNPGSGQSWPVVNAILKMKTDDGHESEVVPISFVKPAFTTDSANAALSTFKIEDGSGVTNKSSVSITNSPAFTAGTITIVPREIVISNLGCGSYSETDWKPYTAAVSGISLGTTLINGTSYSLYVYYRDAAHNTSTCIQSTVKYDNVAPTLSSFTINDGAYQSSTSAVQLKFVSSDDATADAAAGKLKLKITNGLDCTGGTWYAYTVGATLPWTLPGQGQDYISAQIQDVAGNISVCTNQTISYSPFGPADPTSLLLVNASAIDNKNPVSIQVTPVLSGNIAYIYTDSACTTALNASASQHTTDIFAGGAATVQVPLIADGSYVLYSKVVNATLASSHCSSVNVHYQLDTTPAAVSNITSSSLNGAYVTGQAIDVSVNFNKVVTVTGSGLALSLKLNGSVQTASYSSGSGTSSLHFTYNIKSTDFTIGADIASTSAMTLGLSSVIDSSHNPANLTLPSPGSTSSLSPTAQLLMNDVTTVALGSGVGSISNSNPVRIAVGNLSNGWTAQVFTDASCTTSVGSAVSASSTSNSVEVMSTLTDGDGSKVFYAKRFAPGQSTAPCSTAFVNYTLDSTNPRVSSVTTLAADGNHLTGETLEFVVNFSAPVTLSGANPILKLNSNSNAVTAQYSSGNGTAAVHFTYTLLATDLAARLDYFDSNALTTTGTITNSAGSGAILSLPSVGATGSISNASNLQINYIQTLAFGSGILSTDSKSSISIHAGGVLKGWTIGLSKDACSTLMTQVTATATGADFNVSLPSDATYNFRIQLVDPTSGATTCSSATVAYTLDTTGPKVLSVTSTSTDADYATGSNIDISINFNEPAYTTGSPTLTMALVNSTTGTALYTSGSGTTTWHFTYTVLITDAIAKLNYASTTALSLGSGTLTDALGNVGDPTLPVTTSTSSLNSRSIKVNAAVHVIGVVAPLSRVNYAGDILEIVVRWSGPINIASTASVGLVFQTGGTLAVPYNSSQSISTETRYTYSTPSSGTTYLSLQNLGSLAGSYISLAGGTVTTSLSSVTFSDSNLKIRPSAAPILTFAETTSSVNETSGTGSISYGLSTAAADDITVSFRLEPLSAFSAGDYSLPTSSQVIPAGSTTGTLSYSVSNNSNSDGLKSFAIQAVGMSSGRLATGTDSKIIALHDDESGDAVTSVAIGTNHICALYASSKVMCVGDNSSGQLGNGTINAVSAPTTPIRSGATKIVAALYSTCAVMTNGSVMCWGSNSNSQLGVGTSTSIISFPTAISGLSNAVDMSFNASGGCAIYANASDRNIKCWGYNYYGIVGDGTSTTRSSAVSPSVALSNVTSISVSVYHACAISNSSLYCWGLDASGQLGFAYPNGSSYIYPSPTLVPTSVQFTQVVAQAQTTCGLSSSGSIYCWGYGLNGERGDGSVSSTTAVPSTSIAIGPASQLIANHGSSASFCAKQISDGALYCWGYNGSLESSTASTSYNITSPILSLFPASTNLNLFKGDISNCAVDGAGLLSCENLTLTLRKSLFPLDSNVSPLVLNQPIPSLISTDTLSCMTTPSGRTSCLTSVQNPAGDGSSAIRLSPADLGTLAISDMATSGSLGCSLDQNSNVRCWGYSYGIGNGTSGLTNLPSYVMTGANKIRVSSYSLSFNVSCARKTVDGTLWCWGYGSGGQLGPVVTHYVPFQLVASPVSDFASAGSAICVIIGGKVKCIGQNGSGQVGDTTGTNQTQFVDVFDAYSGSAVQLEAGVDFTCGRYDDQSLRCWGSNTSGQIGRGNLNNAVLPSKISGLTVKDFSIGTSHVCAITTANELKCWGSNSSGQLGNGTLTNLTSPPSTPVLTNVSKVWARGNSTCAVASGTYYCWGQNYGLNSYLPSATSILPIPQLQQ